MGFDGFPKEGLKFLADLKRNNRREWFEAHKVQYKQVLEGPAKALLETLLPGLEALAGEALHGKIFRIHRDIRFSTDKSPYNAHVRIAFHCSGISQANCGQKPAFFFSLEPDKVIVGAGSMEFPKMALDRYRNAVVADASGRLLEKILAKCTSKNGFRIEAAELKRVPAGLDAAHPRAELLKHKSLTVWHEESPGTVHESQKCAKHLLEQYKAMQPLFAWLNGI
ncbi:MAG: DUF2461 domain-containing protein [Candidatus Hydrogenedentes bacterium]|nr:DUF2461 domain-containing protein [Candidatus Hydrogenedentota bacterium]